MGVGGERRRVQTLSFEFTKIEDRLLEISVLIRREDEKNVIE